MDTWTNSFKPLSCTESGGWSFGCNDGDKRIYFTVYAGGSLKKYISPNSSKTGASLSTGWHHFVGTYDGFKANLYIDGVLEATSSTGSTTKTPSISFFIILNLPILSQNINQIVKS